MRKVLIELFEYPSGKWKDICSALITIGRHYNGIAIFDSRSRNNYGPKVGTIVKPQTTQMVPGFFCVCDEKHVNLHSLKHPFLNNSLNQQEMKYRKNTDRQTKYASIVVHQEMGRVTNIRRAASGHG